MKKKKKFDSKEIFYENIKSHKNDLPTDFDNVSVNINTNSWFNIKKNNSLLKYKNIKIKNMSIDNELIKCQKIKIILTAEQKAILTKWYTSCTDMYNETLKYIINNYRFVKEDITLDILNEQDETKQFYSFYNIRKKIIDIKKEIIKKSQLNTTEKNTEIYTHILDYSIKQVCSNIKSAMSNLYNGNIKRFRMKYWKKNRPSQTMDIEMQYIRNNKICFPILGNIKYIYNKKDFKLNNITSGVKINYNNIIDEYTLLVPIKTEKIKIENKENNLISLDPGLRTFMTGICENGSIEIGTNINNHVRQRLKRLQIIKNNEKIPNKIKKKNELLINRKISNQIDDLHWKSIHYLVSNYETIILGNMSAKSIVSNENKCLSKLQKKACLRTKYYEFYQRLQYKCNMYDVNYKLVNESYTSMTCSMCSFSKEDLGSSKIYICDKCDCLIDRDINGARNIYIKSLS